MADSPRFSITPEKPLGESPYPQEDRRHEGWAAASRAARERLILFNATTLEKMPPDTASGRQFQDWLLDAAAGQFGIRAAAILAVFGSTQEAVMSCEKTIDRIAEFVLTEAEKTGYSRISRNSLLSELRIRLTRDREYCLGQAYKWVREAERKKTENTEPKMVPAEANPDPPGEPVEPPPSTTSKTAAAPHAQGSKGGTVFSLNAVMGTPTLLPQREFHERRHSLPDASEEVKREFRLLAQEAVILLTRDSSNPLKGVDDWLDLLQSEGDSLEGGMERILSASRDHLLRMRVYDLGIGHDDQAERCGAIATQFGDLITRFFRLNSRSQTAIQEKTSSEDTARRRGRRPNQGRRDAIHNAIAKHGDGWRDRLSDIFKELDSQDVPLGDFLGKDLDLGGGEHTKVSKWDDLDLALGEQRKGIIDVLRKYVD
jgi:hypothetical protein